MFEALPVETVKVESYSFEKTHGLDFKHISNMPQSSVYFLQAPQQWAVINPS